MIRGPRGARNQSILLAKVLRRLGCRTSAAAFRMPKMMRIRMERSTKR